MKELTQVQCLYDAKYHDAVLEMVRELNEKGSDFSVCVMPGSYYTYDPVERRLLLHLFEFIMGKPEIVPPEKPESLFDRFGKATDGTGIIWLATVRG